MKASTWTEIGDRYAVLPETWMDDLLKHHANDCAGLLSSFLEAVPDKERLLVATFNESLEGFHTKAISSVKVSDDFTPASNLLDEATGVNSCLADQYKSFLSSFRGRRDMIRECLVRAEGDAIASLRSTNAQSDESLELAATTVAGLLGVANVRASAYQGQSRDLAVYLAFNLAALRELDVTDKSDHDLVNDVHDLHFLVLGLLTSGLITEDKRLRKAHNVIRRAYRYITNDNLHRFAHIE